MGGGGSGGSTSVPMRQPSQEKGTVGNWYDFQKNQFNDYVSGQPLLNQASQGAQGFWSQLFGPSGTGLLGMKPGGYLTPEGERDASQSYRSIAAQGGNLHSPGAAGAELLNREQFRLGRVQQVQGIQTGALNQLLGVQNAATQNFTSLQNPILGYLGNLYSGNQQAGIANAQIGAQQSAANKSGTAGLAGGALSAIGTVAAAAL